jgi:murein DD-endopeptidase MepM/ murein hydrolase activator NlpD
MRSPIKGGRVNVPFGKKNPRLWRWKGWHTGADLIVPTGTPIIATSNQTIIRADHAGGSYGTWVAARDQSGRIHIYAHMSRLNTRVGRKVIDGTVIGWVGSTGNSTGPHLHYEVRTGKPNADGQWGSPINPGPWMR